MVILNKTLHSITDITNTIPKTKSCEDIWNLVLDVINTTRDAVDNDDKYNYQDILSTVLKMLEQEIPSPFSSLYPNCYGLNVGNDYFTLRFAAPFGFGIRVYSKGGEIKYELSLVFYNDRAFVEQSEYYKELVDAGWKEKKIKH